MNIITQNKDIASVFVVTAVILMVPLIAMQFTSEVRWDETDFAITGALLSGMGSMFVLTARKIRNNSHRVVVGLAFAAALLYLWAELAVGIFTNWGS